MQTVKWQASILGRSRCDSLPGQSIAMTDQTLLIKDARLVNEGCTTEGDVLIRAGRIDNPGPASSALLKHLRRGIGGKTHHRQPRLQLVV